jgi:transketolase
MREVNMSCDLREMSETIRRTTFQAISNAGGGHYGGSLSISEILTVLYFKIMHVDPQHPDNDERDRFILSKGHGGPALYTTLALRGYFPVSDLEKLDKPLSNFPKHIDRLKLKGIEASTGPLGQGLSIACGMGISLKQQNRKNRVFVLMGDGECNSGQLWEAAMTAGKYKLDNLVAFVDRNNCQIDGTCDEIMPMEPLGERFAAFGWQVFETDGHDIDALLTTIEAALQVKDKPAMIVATTVKGKGVSYMENRFEWHSGKVSQEQYEQAVQELGVTT